MGHVLRAHVHTSLWERSVVSEVQSIVARLKALETRSNDREKQHVLALEQWAGGDWDGARTTLEYLSAAYPRDLLALQMGHLGDFFHGDRDNLRGRIARALPHWTGADAGYALVLGMQAFGLEECGSYAAAEQSGRQALDLEPQDCWAHHAVIHVLEMQGHQAEGIAFMQSRQASWAQADNAFQFHNWWHLALFNLDQGQTARALEIYDHGVRAETSEIQMMLLDAVALLWRMHLLGLDVGERWTELVGHYLADEEAGFYSFNDMHALLAFAASGQDAAIVARIEAMASVAESSATNGMMMRLAGLPIARGIQAFARGQYAAAVDHLMPVRNRAQVCGGSHAQRDIVQRTLLESALRSPNKALACALTNERRALRPHCPFTWQLVLRAQAL